MFQSTAEAKAILRDLGDGLVLRQGRLDDAEALEDFQATRSYVRPWARERSLHQAGVEGLGCVVTQTHPLTP